MDFNNPASLSAAAKGDLTNAIVAATPGGIEAQEAAGQRALVSNFTRLPKKYGCWETLPKDLLERLGFVIGEDEDALFVKVTAPAGWSMRATDHSMHSDIVDDKGRKRGSVFYKAAFYDRRASFNLERRYVVHTIYGDSTDQGYPLRHTVKDNVTGDLLFEQDFYRMMADKGDVIKSQQIAACTAWLDEHLPDHKNLEAYW